MRWLMKLRRTFLMATAVGVGVIFGVGSQSAAQTAQAPRGENARFETRALAGPLDAACRGIVVQAEKPQWMGDSVAQIADERTLCCGNYRDGEAEGRGPCRSGEHNEG